MHESTFDLIAAEFREMPGLRLTSSQAARLWSLPADDAAAILDVLVARGVLGRAHDGQYCRPQEIWRVPTVDRPAGQ